MKWRGFSRMFRRLFKLKDKCPIIREVRGIGFMVGIELSVEGKPVVDAARGKREKPPMTRAELLARRAGCLQNPVGEEHQRGVAPRHVGQRQPRVERAQRRHQRPLREVVEFQGGRYCRGRRKRF